MLPILRLTQAEYREAIFQELGKGRQHASLLYSEWFRKGSYRGLDPAFLNASRLHDSLLRLTDWQLPLFVRQISEGETTKFLLKVEGGLETESVVIPMEAGRTLCLSSQVGCRMGCAFCETARMGLVRNLRAEEIVAQVFVARHGLGLEIRNLVFMGMGEPLDNYEEVMRAICVLTDSGGFGFAPRHITVSTSGKVAEIYRLMDEADPSLKLAVSVNAPNNATRQRLMPVNREADMGALREAMQAYCQHPKREILIEYVLIHGINDSEGDADQLAAYLQGLRVKINLIPYNPQNRSAFRAPVLEVREAFARRLRDQGYLVLLRGTKGQAIMAACGQLGNRQLRRAIQSRLAT